MLLLTIIRELKTCEVDLHVFDKRCTLHSNGKHEKSDIYNQLRMLENTLICYQEVQYYFLSEGWGMFKMHGCLYIK